MSIMSATTPVTTLAALNRIQGWMGTLVLSSDGSILQSAGDLVNCKDIAERFAAMANRIGRFLVLDNHSETSEFRRLIVYYRTCMYIMTCVGDTIYVVKRASQETDPVEGTTGVPSPQSEDHW
ncbi:unnamed protein product [Dicrocoelium dendriticum]|nr:unnamed protein product [Dicrocoelium dendriticum]